MEQCKDIVRDSEQAWKFQFQFEGNMASQTYRTLTLIIPVSTEERL